MKNIKFKQANTQLLYEATKRGEASLIVPVHYINKPGIMTTCYQMSWSERLSALFFGKVWLAVRTNKFITMPAVLLTAKKTVFENLN